MAVDALLEECRSSSRMEGDDALILEEQRNDVVKRRQEIAKSIHSLWTRGGSDLAGLAGPMFDGRLDAMGRYTMLLDFHEADPVMKHVSIEQIAYRDMSRLSPAEFRNEFMVSNIPVMICGLTKNWQARKWLRQQGERMVPDMDYLRNHFGMDVAPVHEQINSGFTLPRPTTEEMTVSEYADWWEIHHDSEPTTASLDLEPDPDAPLLYLKDWKFVAVHPDWKAYEWPLYFRDDWLNGAMGDAYRFIYLGPKGTSTRLHADVLRSFSWSTNVCGRKRWYLVPPQYTYLLMDCFGQALASHLTADLVHGVEVDSLLFPGLKYARRYAIEVVQEAGETIFVPSKWYHTVENLEPTLSINHNWLNGANIRWSWETLQAELGACNDTTSTANNQSQTTSAQAGDDLVLLWLVLSKKAREILATKGDPKDDEMSLFNLKAILPILEGIQIVIRDGKEQGLTQRCVCDIDDLVESVERALQQQSSSQIE
jgi:hypothetical protein